MFWLGLREGGPHTGVERAIFPSFQPSVGGWCGAAALGFCLGLLRSGLCGAGVNSADGVCVSDGLVACPPFVNLLLLTGETCSTKLDESCRSPPTTFAALVLGETGLLLWNLIYVTVEIWEIIWEFPTNQEPLIQTPNSRAPIIRTPKRSPNLWKQPYGLGIIVTYFKFLNSTPGILTPFSFLPTGGPQGSHRSRFLTNPRLPLSVGAFKFLQLCGLGLALILLAWLEGCGILHIGEEGFVQNLELSEYCLQFGASVAPESNEDCHSLTAPGMQEPPVFWSGTEHINRCLALRAS